MAGELVSASKNCVDTTSSSTSEMRKLPPHPSGREGYTLATNGQVIDCRCDDQLCVFAQV